MKYNYFLQMRNGRLLNEGGWETARDALDFFDAEVGGVFCRVVRKVEQTGQLLPQTAWLDPQASPAVRQGETR